jgi:hypothetical protein
LLSAESEGESFIFYEFKVGVGVVEIAAGCFGEIFGELASFTVAD